MSRIVCAGSRAASGVAFPQLDANQRDSLAYSEIPWVLSSGICSEGRLIHKGRRCEYLLSKIRSDGLKTERANMSSIFALALFAQVIVANPVYRRQDITTTATNATATPTIDPTLSDNVTSTATDSITLTSEPTPTTDTFTVPITSTISTPSPTGGSEDDGSYWFCSFPGAEATPTPTSDPTTIVDPFPTTTDTIVIPTLTSDTLSSTDTLTLSIPTDTETNIPTATDTSTFPEVTDTDLPTFSDTEIPTATETATSTDVSTSVEATSTALPTATESSTLPEITSIASETDSATEIVTGTATSDPLTTDVLTDISTATLSEPALTTSAPTATITSSRPSRVQTYTVVGPSTTAVITCVRVKSPGRPGRPPYPHHPFPHHSRPIASENATDAAPASTLSENTAIPTTTFGVVGDFRTIQTSLNCQYRQFGIWRSLATAKKLLKPLGLSLKAKPSFFSTFSKSNHARHGRLERSHPGERSRLLVPKERIGSISVRRRRPSPFENGQSAFVPSITLMPGTGSSHGCKPSNSATVCSGLFPTENARAALCVSVESDLMMRMRRALFVLQCAFSSEHSDKCLPPACKCQRYYTQPERMVTGDALGKCNTCKSKSAPLVIT
ncbi:hypothetical protein AG1IA_00411 [Rhizoctonia solani AG-1 IA]|uniref:Uncharacterized protein n=2 Tax=Rhizoctonia solani TaxID=456999 RepID=L8X8X9_THACA|nr:hypothetical protein AG1IA_00411 [Rhizoctonia solani AG-1 IA]